MKKRIGTAILVGGIALILAGNASAMTVAVGEQIINGTFGTGTGTLSGWTTGGTANTRAVTDTINASGGNGQQSDTFDRGLATNDSPFFSSAAFAVLGDTSGKIGGPGPHSGTHTLSQSFTLDSFIDGTAVLSYNLDFSFMSAFDGNANTGDVFSAELVLPDLSVMILMTQTRATGQQNNDPFTQTLMALAPGTYTLRFRLLELSGGGGNPDTAAGLDNISVTGTASVVPLPAAVWLFGSAMVSLLGLNRRRRI